MRIFFAVEDMDICAWHRCQVPANALNAAGHTAKVSDGLRQSDIDWCDVLVIERLWEPSILDAIAYAKAHAKLTVYELDDDYWSIHASNPSAQFWTPDKLASMVANLKACDRVTTTTQHLASILARWHSDIRVLPNMLRSDEWTHDHEEHDPLVIGWAGSNSHRIDVGEMGDVLTQILDRHEGVVLKVAGVPPEWFGTHERIEALEPVPLGDYPALLQQFDIGLAPLADTRFNRSKSDLKVLEYAASGIPCVASAVTSYADTPALKARNHKDWMKHLTRLVTDARLRRDMASTARAWTQTRTIEGSVRLWESAYETRELAALTH